VRVAALFLIVAGCDGIWDLEHLPSPDASQLPPDLAAWFPMEAVVDGKVTDAAGPHEGVCLASECPAAGVGKVGNALVFDGMTQVVNAPSSAALDAHRSLTVALWVRVDREITGAACVFSKLYFGPTTDNSWQFCVSGGLWHFYSWPVIDALGPPPAVGKWQHLAASWEQSTSEVRVYQNGFVVGQPLVGDIPFDDGRLVIGADVDAGQTLVYFPGAVDDVRIYTRALAADEIVKLATAP
jgi:hypothetical protein